MGLRPGPPPIPPPQRFHIKCEECPNDIKIVTSWPFLHKILEEDKEWTVLPGKKFKYYCYNCIKGE